MRHTARQAHRGGNGAKADGKGAGGQRELLLWQVADNLRKGAATNAVQIAEALLP